MITFRSKTSLGDITVDVILRIKHGVEVQVSTSPLENGADITDHVRVQPQGLEMVGIITPTEQTLLSQVTGGGAGAVGAALGLRDGQRDVEGWLGLKALLSARRRIEIVTRYQTYFVLPISLLADEDAGFGMALQFSMRFLEIEQGSVKSLDQIAVDLRDSIGGKTGTDNIGQQQLGAEEDVPLAQAKPRRRVINPFTTAYETGSVF